jgi:hypothetical protein
MVQKAFKNLERGGKLPMFASRLFFFLRNDDIYPHLRFCNYLDGGAWIDDGGLDEPGQAEAKQDVEYVAADGIAHRHVP